MSAEAAQVCAIFLRQGRLLDRLAMGLALLGLLLTLAPAWGFATPLAYWLLGSLLLLIGCIEKYWALRVALDADLFQHIAIGQLSLSGLDQALTEQQLLPPNKASRSLNDRCRGAYRLLRWQLLCVLLQACLLLALLIIGFIQGAF